MALNEALALFCHEHLLTRRDEFPPTFYTLQDERRRQLDLRKNTIIHYFVSISCIAVSVRSLLKTGQTRITYAQLLEDYLLCRKLFQHEFFFATRLSPIDHLVHQLEFLERTKIISIDHNAEIITASDPRTSSKLRPFAMLLRNYFEAYKTVMLSAQFYTANSEDHSTNFATRSLDFAKHLLPLGKIVLPEAVSSITFNNAIKAFKTLEVLSILSVDKKGRPINVAWHCERPLAKILQAKLEVWR